MIGMTRRLSLGLVVLGLATLGGVGFASANAARADCPGKVVCPLTGELVCRDRCPTTDKNRADCPGRIECPVTGELVCRDLCPASGSRPSCCEAGK